MRKKSYQWIWDLNLRCSISIFYLPKIYQKQLNQHKKAMRIELKGCVGLPDCWMMHLYSLSFFVTRYICTQYSTRMWLPSSQLIIFCPKNWSFWHTVFGLSVNSWWSECTPPLPTIVKWLNFADSWSLLTQHLHFAYLNQIKES